MKKLDKNSVLSRCISAFGSHVVGIIISLFICISISTFMTSTVGLIASQIIVLIVYCYPVYTFGWSLGHTDLNRSNFGHIKLNRSLGFKVAALSSIPVAVMSVLFIASKLGWFYNFTLPYWLLNAHTWPIMRLIEPSRYLPDYNWLQVLLYAIVPLVSILIIGVSYIMGSYDFSPMQKIIYKNKKNIKKS